MPFDRRQIVAGKAPDREGEKGNLTQSRGGAEIEEIRVLRVSAPLREILFRETGKLNHGCVHCDRRTPARATDCPGLLSAVDANA